MKVHTFLSSIILVLMCSIVYSAEKIPASPTKDDVVVLLLDSRNVRQSINMVNTMKSGAILSELKENNQNYYFFYGNLQPEYCEQHKVASFPAILRFRRNQSGKFYEVRRLCGEKTMTMPYLINFLTFKALQDIVPQQQTPISPPTFPDPRAPYNPNTSLNCPPGGS